MARVKHIWLESEEFGDDLGVDAIRADWDNGRQHRVEFSNESPDDLISALGQLVCILVTDSKEGKI